jgi:hypothetical protein
MHKQILCEFQAQDYLNHLKARNVKSVFFRLSMWLSFTVFSTKNICVISQLDAHGYAAYLVLTVKLIMCH